MAAVPPFNQPEPSQYDQGYALGRKHGAEAAAKKIELLKTWLEMALDSYEDLNNDLQRDESLGHPNHFVTQARKALK